MLEKTSVVKALTVVYGKNAHGEPTSEYADMVNAILSSEKEAKEKSELLALQGAELAITSPNEESVLSLLEAFLQSESYNAKRVKNWLTRAGFTFAKDDDKRTIVSKWVQPSGFDMDNIHSSLVAISFEPPKKSKDDKSALDDSVEGFKALLTEKQKGFESGLSTRAENEGSYIKSLYAFIIENAESVAMMKMLVNNGKDAKQILSDALADKGE